MATSRWSLQGRTVLITGAARGIGAESARRVAARGARVSLVGLEPEELERVASECGGEAAAFEADVTDWDALERAAEGTVERFGGIDAVVANAGIYAAGTVRSIEPAAFERTIEINLLGAWRTVRTCLPHVLERQGYVLVVTSLAAMVHSPGMAAYAASKAGAEAFANSLRGEVKHMGVDVGVGYFSFIDTDLTRGGEEHPMFALLRERSPGPLRRNYPVSAAGEAITRTIESRGRRALVPGWLRAVQAMRGVLPALVDRASAGEVPGLDQRFEEDVARRGEEASAPVGAGGEAVRETVVNRI
jgi:NAD(P)-dependent dehydrogenase (short-subunit alcohol dehydrogenase family)